MHSQVNYIVAHGISSSIEGRKVVMAATTLCLRMRSARSGRSTGMLLNSCRRSIPHLYLAADNVLEAVICIEDPLREEAAPVLRSCGRPASGSW